MQQKHIKEMFTVSMLPCEYVVPRCNWVAQADLNSLKNDLMAQQRVRAFPCLSLIGLMLQAANADFAAFKSDIRMNQKVLESRGASKSGARASFAG